MKIRKRPQKKSLWHILPRAVKKRIWMPGLFALLLGTDEALKQYVQEYLEPGEERVLPGGKLLYRKVYNPGFAFGTFAQHPEAVRNLSLAAGVVVLGDWVRNLCRKGHLLAKTGTTLTAAGAAGNLLDRLLRGKVVDYIGFRSEHAFLAKLTANLADFYLAAGALLMTLRKILGSAGK